MYAEFIVRYIFQQAFTLEWTPETNIFLYLEPKNMVTDITFIMHVLEGYVATGAKSSC